jgi:hypothetical protein
MRRLAAATLLSLALAFMAAPAGAQDAAQAKRFAAAQKLFDEGAYTPALMEFKALAAETASPNAELYAALCLRELGKLPEAYEAMASALRNATAKAEAEPKYKSTRNKAATELALLEPRIGKLVVAVARPPAGLRVTLNGAALPLEKLGAPVAAAVGEAVVRLTAPGTADVERRVQLRGGEVSTVTVAFDTPGNDGGLTRDASRSAAPTPGEPSAEGTPPGAPPPASRGGGARIAGFVTLGIGAAGMATFATAGVMANNRYDAINAACGGKHCTDPSFASQIDGGRRLDIIADVGLGVGIAGIAAGTLLAVLGGPKAAPANVTAWAASRGGGLAVRASW